MKKSVVFFSLFLSIAAVAEEDSANPAESKTKMPTDSAAQRKDVDQEITNPKLRAETGAKSLFSIQTAFQYNGGSVSDPTGRLRPRLSPGQIELDPTKITGNVSLKYRATDHDNLNAGTGFGWLTPSHDGERGQVENPFLQYSRPFRTGDFQNVFSAQYMYFSSYNSRNTFKLNYEVQLSHTVLTNIGSTRWQVGGAFVYSHDVYSAQQSLSPKETLAAFPFAEYWFNDRVHFRTVYRGLSFFNTNGRRDLFQRDDPTQSLGFGFVVTRDVYLYPNIQWVWEDMKSERTNIALNANINL